MSSLNQALRNKLTLEWLRALPLASVDPRVLTKGKVALAYSKHLQCPLCELDLTWTQQDDLDYLYRNYSHLIENT